MPLVDAVSAYLARLRSTLPARVGFRQRPGNWWDRGSARGHPGTKRSPEAQALLKARARMKKQSQRINRANGQRERSGSQRRIRS